jgi:hypothetical protein
MKGRPRNSVLPRSVPHLLLQPCGVLIGKWTGGVCHGRGYVLLATEVHFSMLASLQKDYKGAVAIALLNYCAPFFQV